MTTTAASIVNRALQQIAARATVTGTNPSFDGSAAGNAAGLFYTPVVDLMLRSQDWEFSQMVADLVDSSVPAGYPWSFSYLYPSDCQRIRSVSPATWDANDPQSVRWSVSDKIISAVHTRIIECNIAAATLVYSTSNVTEAEWDTIFQEAVVRMLASLLAIALGGRPDLAKEKLKEAGGVMLSGDDKDS